MNTNIESALKDKKNTHYQVKASGIGKASIKEVDLTKRIVTGFFNSYNFLDSDNDVLLPGAAKRSIKARGVESEAVAKIKHAVNHDLTMLPGKLMVLREKTIDGITGIYFETKMSDTTLGNDTLINYQEGIYDNHSIGFRYKQIEMMERGTDGYREIIDELINPKEAAEKDVIFAVKEIELFEGSTVAFGANSLTPFLGIKSGNKDATLLALQTRMDKLIKTLKSGMQSDEMMHTFEVQVLQIKQMMSELMNEIQIIKVAPIAIEKSVEKEIVPIKINLRNITESL